MVNLHVWLADAQVPSVHQSPARRATNLLDFSLRGLDEGLDGSVTQPLLQQVSGTTCQVILQNLVTRRYSQLSPAPFLVIVSVNGFIQNVFADKLQVIGFVALVLTGLTVCVAELHPGDVSFPLTGKDSEDGKESKAHCSGSKGCSCKTRSSIGQPNVWISVAEIGWILSPVSKNWCLRWSSVACEGDVLLWEAATFL